MVVVVVVVVVGFVVGFVVGVVVVVVVVVAVVVGLSDSRPRAVVGRPPGGTWAGRARKPPSVGPGLPEAQNGSIAIRDEEETIRDFDGLRTAEFRPLRPVAFRWFVRLV